MRPCEGVNREDSHHFVSTDKEDGGITAGRVPSHPQSVTNGGERGNLGENTRIFKTINEEIENVRRNWEKFQLYPCGNAISC